RVVIGGSHVLDEEAGEPLLALIAHRHELLEAGRRRPCLLLPVFAVRTHGLTRQRSAPAPRAPALRSIHRPPHRSRGYSWYRARAPRGRRRWLAWRRPRPRVP